MARKLLALLLAVALLSPFAVAGERIKVYFGQQIWTDSALNLIPDFEKETGIKVDYEVYGEQQLSQKLIVMFAGGSSELDVYFIRPPQEAKMMQKNGWAEDLTPYFKDDAEYDFADFNPASAEATNYGGQQVCIPVMNESHVIYYRKDIFDQKGLKAPTTFAELEATAKALHDPANEFYGIAMRGARSPLVTQFSSYLYGFGSDFFDFETKKSKINTPEFLEAAEFYGRMAKNYGSPGTLNMGWFQAIAVFQQGKAAMYLDASSQYPNLLDPNKSTVADKTGVAIFPAGPKAHRFYDVTCWGVCMSSKSQKKDAAWKFIRWITDKKRNAIIQGDYAVQGARRSTFQTPEGVKKFPPDLTEALAAAGKYGYGYDRPRVTSVEEARDIIGTVVTTAIEGGNLKAAAVTGDAKLQELLDRED